MTTDATALVKTLLDGESPKDFIKRKNLGTRQYLKVGSVSHGTSVAEHIIPRCIEALFLVDQNKAKDCAERYQKLVEMPPEDVEYEDSSLVHFLYYRMFPLLQKYCPPFTYFGSNEGDGSDIGCWPCNETIQQGLDDGVIADMITNTPWGQDFLKGKAVLDRDVRYVLMDRSKMYTRSGTLLWHFR